jgi:hypothetical protein
MKKYKDLEKSIITGKKCIDPEHDFPMFLWIPEGHSHTHVCPSCGNSQTVHNPIKYEY